MQKPWLKHYPPEIPATLEYPDRIVPDLLKEAYENKPNHIAIRFMGKQLTYAELYQAAVDCARALVKLGVKPGDRVSIMLPNCPQYVISYYGILMAGAVVVQTNPLYVERELEYQLNDAGAQTIIALDLVFPKIAKVQARTPLKNVIITSIKDYLPFPKNVLYPLVVKKKQGIQVNVEYGNTVHNFKKWLKTGEGVSLNISQSPDDVALLQYTGGTTGTPKGVMLTHRNLVVNTYQCKAWMYKAEYGQERSLGIVPLFHVYGMTVVMNISIAMASTMILVPKFEVDDALKTIDKERPTLFPGAPTMYIALINHPDVGKYDLSSIKACLSGSAPLPVEVKNKFEALTNGKLVEGYGLSETSPVTHANLIWGKNVVGSIGIPWPDTDVTVISPETGEPAATGEIGEIAIKGPQVMKGYWNRPEETEKVFKDGWFLTGDMGYMDEEGYFYIVDRKKDMIIAGGFNIYPREVEEVLYEHPAVQECAVIGVPDEYRGETVKAFIVRKEGKQVTEEELEQYCRSKLAAYKVPRIYEFRDELPKSMVGKVLRRVLVDEERKKAEQERDQNVGS
ncbi:long-chain-fatty-acid--CoA ligase [Caldalkalibacillus uzonensis]